MARLNIDRQKKLEPTRLQKAIDEIENRGFQVYGISHDSIRFMYLESEVIYFPYSGWATGKTIKDGRGLNTLLNQINNGKK